MYHNFIIHSSVNGHLDCFHVLAICDEHLGTCVFFNFGFLGYMPRSTIVVSYGSFIPNF